MDDTYQIDHSELEYRKKHFRKAHDVLSSSILCAICKTDLKRTIISNENIMVHKTFLCLCCENCFEQLSNSQNGCIFCSGKIKLKACEICDNKMCKKCIDGFMGSANMNSLKKCLRCYPKWLWSQRSQAADVLKCFSLELGNRLLLSGEESEEKQNLLKFLMSTAKCDENLSQEVIDRLRVKLLLCDPFNSKIEMLLSKQNLEYETTKEIKNEFNKVCDQILVDTCKVLLDLKCFFDKNNVGPLNTLKSKVNSLLRINSLFQNPVKDDKSFESSQSKNSLLKHTNIEQNVAEASNSVSDINLNPQIKKENFEKNNMNVGKKPKRRKLNNTGIEQNIVEVSNSVARNSVIKLARLATNNINGHIGRKSKRKLNNADIEQNVAAASNIVHDKINLNPVVKLEKFDMEFMNTLISPKSKKKLNNTDIGQNVVNTSNLVNQTLSMMINVKNTHDLTRQKSKRKMNNRVVRLCFDEALNSVGQTRSEKFDRKNTNDQIQRKSTRKSNTLNIEQNMTEASNSVNDTINLSPVIKLERLSTENMSNRLRPKRPKRNVMINLSPIIKLERLNTENMNNRLRPKGPKRNLNRELIDKNTDEITDTFVKENGNITTEETPRNNYKKKCRRNLNFENPYSEDAQFKRTLRRRKK